MRVNIAQATPPSLSPPSSHNASSSTLPTTKLRLHRSESAIFGGSLLNLGRSKSTAHTSLRRCCSASATFDGHDFPPKFDHPTPNKNTHNLNFPTHHNNNSNTLSTASFRHHKLDVLEPSLLGIRPEPPDWPARDEVIRDCIARRASSIELPLSLRIIKMKQRLQRLEEEREIGDLLGENVNNHNNYNNNNNNNPISNLCCSTLYIIKELQSQAMKIRGVVLDEDLDGIVSKVQKEMTSSFVWLSREVFAKTPDLMLQVMLLTSNFATHSLESYPLPETLQNLKIEEDKLLEQKKKNSRDWGNGCLELEKSGVPMREILEESEVGLWNSMVEEANEMKGYDDHHVVKVDEKGFVFDHDYDDNSNHDGLMEKEMKFEFVSPVRVEIEEDDYEEFNRTDLLYQIGLSHDPNNPLLLSNYAQFLRLVSRDYDRAEECFKRAIQMDPTDSEVVSQYATFLWVVRNDLWGAEERFLQAMSAEPDNSYHASKYASFLWSTGGEDTCYPLDDPPRGKS